MNWAMPVVICLTMSQMTCGVEPDSNRPRQNDPKSESPARRFNLKTKTLGGLQLWSDVHYFHGWHIQQHASTGHFRLLDSKDVRHAWGSKEECISALEEIRKQQELAAMSGKAVILIHGIGRSANSMRAIRRRLNDREYATFGFNYASTRIDIPTAAGYLHELIESLDGIEEISFVVHSMGGLVVRSYLSQHRDKRIERLVMLGVPNSGATLAKDLKDVWLFKVISGPAGQQLAKDPQGFTAGLPTPDFEFAVIAGSRGTLQGYNPMIPGDDDGTVAVESTKLPGAADFLAVRRLHSFMMFAPEVIDATERFIVQGKLRKDGPRHPILKPKKDSDKSSTTPTTSENQKDKTRR